MMNRKGYLEELEKKMDIVEATKKKSLAPQRFHVSQGLGNSALLLVDDGTLFAAPGRSSPWMGPKHS